MEKTYLNLIFIFILTACSSGPYQWHYEKKEFAFKIEKPIVLISGKYVEPTNYQLAAVNFEGLKFPNDFTSVLKELNSMQRWSDRASLVNRAFYFYERMKVSDLMEGQKQAFLILLKKLTFKSLRALESTKEQVRTLAKTSDRKLEQLNFEFHIPLAKMIYELPNHAIKYQLAYQNFDFIQYNFFESENKEKYHDLLKAFHRKLRSLPAISTDSEFLSSRGESDMQFLYTKLQFELKRLGITKS